MKKNFAFIALFGIFCAMPVLADGCGESRIKLKGFQKAHDDEFVYSTMNAYQSSAKCSGSCSVVGGLVYECDNTYCGNTSWLLADTNDFVMEGLRQKKFTLFICSTGIADRWQNYGVISKCSGDGITSNGVSHLVNHNAQYKVLWDKKKMQHCYLPISEEVAKQETSKPANTLLGSNTVQELLSKQGDPCTAAQLKQINAKSGVLVQILATKDGKLQCSATECESGMEKYNVNGAVHCRTPQKVSPKPTTDPTPDPKPDPDNKFTEGQDCPADYLTKVNAHAGYMTAVDTENPICVPTQCMQGAYKTIASDDDPYVRCVYPFEICKDDEELETFPDGTTSLKCLHKKSEEESVSTPQGDIAVRITDAYAEFNGMTENLKTKKWRNKDGKFNTARLASDGVAGVVLGTTAGLITAHVVKKGQIKNGFEDIKCTIGGQTVSDWGDELTVGVR